MIKLIAVSAKKEPYGSRWLDIKLFTFRSRSLLYVSIEYEPKGYDSLVHFFYEMFGYRSFLTLEAAVLQIAVVVGFFARSDYLSGSQVKTH